MRETRFFAVALVLFTCGLPATARSEAGEAAAARRGAGSEVEIGATDRPEPGRRQRAARLERGEVVAVKFEGEFVAGGLPASPARMIPLDGHDIRFTLEVEVVRILEGRLPEGWASPVTFGVHSLAVLFGLNGIETAEGRDLPEGRFLLTLWRAPDGQYDLEIDPGEALQ